MDNSSSDAVWEKMVAQTSNDTRAPSSQVLWDATTHDVLPAEAEFADFEGVINNKSSNNIGHNNRMIEGLEEHGAGIAECNGKYIAEQGECDIQLINDIEVELSKVRRHYPRKLLSYLLGVARRNGNLPVGVRGISRKSIAKSAQMPVHTLKNRAPARLILDNFIDRFNVKLVRNNKNGNAKNDRIGKIVRNWLSTNPVVPSLRDGVISFREVAEIIKIPYEDLRGDRYAQSLIRRAIASQVVRLDAVPVRPKDELIEGLSKKEAQDRIDRLKEVVMRLDKIPEKWRPRGHIDYEYIADLTGTREPTMKNVASYRSWVIAQARQKGMMIPRSLESLDTVAAFGEWGLAKIESEAKIKNQKSWSAKVANQKTNYNKLVNAAGAQPEDEASCLFSLNYEDLILKAQAGLKGESASNVRRGLEQWFELRQLRTTGSDLPAEFSKALYHILRSRGISIRRLAETIEMNHATLSFWVNGSSSPSRTNLHYIRKIEDFLGLPTETLTSKLRYVSVRSPIDKNVTDEYKAVDHRIKQLLPDGASAWEPGILAEAVTRLQPLLTAGTQQGNIVRASLSNEHLMEPFAPTRMLSEQLENYVSYKRSVNPYPFLRSYSGHWESDATEGFGIALIEQLFRFVVQPTDARLASGMGVDADLQTIAWLGCPSIVLAAAGYRAYRYHDQDWGDGKRGVFYTSSEEILLAYAISMTHPETGWLTQNKQLADSLIPISRTIPQQFTDLMKFHGPDSSVPLLSEADVVFAKTDWEGFMRQSHRHFCQAKNYVEKIKKTSRDPISPIAGIFNSATPMADLLTCIIRAEQCWPNRRTSPKLHAIAVRNSVMLRIESMVVFRPKNLTGLTFFSDVGQIRKRDGLWEIEVPHEHFKNSQNCRLFGPKTCRRNFHMILRDEANFYELLDYYFFDVINEFKSDASQKAAFLTKCGNIVSPDIWNVIVRNFGRLHVAWNPVKHTGIPGVVSLNPYAFRHIRASDILRNSMAYNKVEEAAFALQTSEGMIIDHYGMLIPNAALQSASDTFSMAHGIAMKRLQDGGFRSPSYH